MRILCKRARVYTTIMKEAFPYFLWFCWSPEADRKRRGQIKLESFVCQKHRES